MQYQSRRGQSVFLNLLPTRPKLFWLYFHLVAEMTFIISSSKSFSFVAVNIVEMKTWRPNSDWFAFWLFHIWKIEFPHESNTDCHMCTSRKRQIIWLFDLPQDTTGEFYEFGRLMSRVWTQSASSQPDLMQSEASCAAAQSVQCDFLVSPCGVKNSVSEAFVIP